MMGDPNSPVVPQWMAAGRRLQQQRRDRWRNIRDALLIFAATAPLIFLALQALQS